MSKRGKEANHLEFTSPALVASALAQRHQRALFLPAFLSTQAEKQVGQYRTERERAHAILLRWADLEVKGVLGRKETSLDADFLREVFGDALGYRSATEGGPDYQLERAFTVPGVGTADGAIGNFTAGSPGTPAAVIELKAADVHLDTDRFNGRTAVQQCWDYLNALPGCAWGIVSNFVSFRLYHQSQGSRAFEHFTLQELRKPERFREFFYLLGPGGLLPTKLDTTPRAERLLRMTGARQREVGD